MATKTDIWMDGVVYVGKLGNPHGRYRIPIKTKESEVKEMYRELEIDKDVFKKDDFFYDGNDKKLANGIMIGMRVDVPGWFRPLFQDSDIENGVEIVEDIVHTLKEAKEAREVWVNTNVDSRGEHFGFHCIIIRTPKQPKLIELRDVDPDKEYWVFDEELKWVGPVFIQKIDFKDKMAPMFFKHGLNRIWTNKATLENMGEK